MSTIFLSLLLLISSAAANHKLKLCYNATYYFHDVLYNGTNYENATAAIVGGPAWGNTTIKLAEKKNHFGNMVVFNDPITLHNKFTSPPIGWAQGFYFYDGAKDALTSWLGFTFVFNCSDLHETGTITFAGADPILKTTRDISIVGGTGNFTMARGIATLKTDAYEGEVYFRLRVDIKLYERSDGTNWNCS